MKDPYWYFIITPLVLLAIQIATCILVYRISNSARITRMIEELITRLNAQDNGNMPTSLDTLRAKRARAAELIEIQKEKALDDE